MEETTLNIVYERLLFEKAHTRIESSFRLQDTGDHLLLWLQIEDQQRLVTYWPAEKRDLAIEATVDFARNMQKLIDRSGDGEHYTILRSHFNRMPAPGDLSEHNI